MLVYFLYKKFKQISKKKTYPPKQQHNCIDEQMIQVLQSKDNTETIYPKQTPKTMVRSSLC